MNKDGIMKAPSKPQFISTVILVLAVMLIVKLGWFAVELTLLDAKGVEYTKPSQAKALYYRTRFASQKLQQKKVVKPKLPTDTIRNIKLLAIYRADDLIVVTVSKNNKATVLTRGGTIDGYMLDDATAREAIFTRSSKRYKIALEKSKASGKSSVKYSDKQERRRSRRPEIDNTSTEGINNTGEITTVDRTLLEKYTAHMDDIWKNIGINETQVDGKIVGFQVTFVRRGSDFAKLGLRRGDVITAINGDVLDSYAKALEAYKNFDTIENLTLSIKRKKEEMELEYEIK